MAMSINTNAAALNSQRNLNASQGSLQTAMQRLSTGLRVNGAKDDGSGLAVAERLNAQVRGSNVAIRNTNDALGMTQMADSALAKIAESVQRMRDLAVQGANGTNNTTDYTNISSELNEIATEITRIQDGTRYNNGTNVLFGATVDFQVGANDETAFDRISVTFAVGAGVANARALTGITSVTDATTAIGNLDAALEDISTERVKLGAYQNRFDAVVSTLQSDVETLSTARGRIMDADFAHETSNLSRSQVLQQAGTAMLAQANQSAQNVMQLLR